jgi:hypothetical protein
MNTIQKWWEAIKGYTLASTVGIDREKVESYLETVEFRDIVKSWDDHRMLKGGTYPQILRGLLHKFPSDRTDQKDNTIKLPGWLDYELHNWGSEKERGWTLHIYAKGHVLTITRRGRIDWEEIKEGPPDGR